MESFTRRCRDRSFPRNVPHKRRVSSVTSVLLICFSVSGCFPFADKPYVPIMPGGIQVDGNDSQVWMDALLAQGLDAIQMTIYARQQAWNSPDLIFHENGDGLIANIRMAKDAGLSVTLVLRVALEQGDISNRHHWHGTIWPEEEDIANWFRNYSEFALWAAGIASSENVDLFVIGSELNSLTSTVAVDKLPELYRYFLSPERTSSVRESLVRCAAEIPAEDIGPDLQFPDGGNYGTLDEYLRAQEFSDRAWTQYVTGASEMESVNIDHLNKRRATYEKYWRELIVNIRDVYVGPMSYAANFDQFQEVGFWDALDVVGVNAYFPLSLRGQAGQRLEEAMTASWLRVTSQLNDLATHSGGPGGVLPVMFFELGWTTKAASTVRPFSYQRVEVLETVPPSGPRAAPVLTCVHWATAPEDPFERVRALEALVRVVEQGAFPTLRGFTLWKLTTNPKHRNLEPFAVVIPSGSGPISDNDEIDIADRAYLHSAARLAELLRLSASAGR